MRNVIYHHVRCVEEEWGEKMWPIQNCIWDVWLKLHHWLTDYGEGSGKQGYSMPCGGQDEKILPAPRNYMFWSQVKLA